MPEWVKMNDIDAAYSEGKVWALSRGDQRRLIIADTEDEARARVDDGDTWHCERFSILS